MEGQRPMGGRRKWLWPLVTALGLVVAVVGVVITLRALPDDVALSRVVTSSDTTSVSTHGPPSDTADMPVPGSNDPPPSATPGAPLPARTEVVYQRCTYDPFPRVECEWIHVGDSSGGQVVAERSSTKEAAADVGATKTMQSWAGFLAAVAGLITALAGLVAAFRVGRVQTRGPSTAASGTSSGNA